MKLSVMAGDKSLDIPHLLKLHLTHNGKHFAAKANHGLKFRPAGKDKLCDPSRLVIQDRRGHSGWGAHECHCRSAMRADRTRPQPRSKPLRLRKSILGAN